MARLVHKATDQLSAEGCRVMLAGFRSKLSNRMIAAQIEQATGEVVAERTLGRRHSEWRAEQSRRQAAREQVQDLVAAMKAEDWSAAEMVQALATDALMMDPERFTGADPLKVQGQNLKAEELRLKREEMEMRRRALELDERKFALMADREKRAIEAAEALAGKAGAGEKLTVEDLNRIREVYGLKPVASGVAA